MTRRSFLLSAAAVAATASLRCQSPPAQTKPMNVVVFLADSMRVDHLGCYGHLPKTTPVLDAFSRDSIVFDRCYSQCCWTKPSIASLFSGYVPQVHLAGDVDWNFGASDDASVQTLRPCFPTIAEQFHQRGYRTAYFLSNSYLQKRFGFARGFDHYQYQNAWAASEQMQAALEWLKTNAQDPFFLFVHEIDPHQPYTPSPEKYEQLFGQTHEAAMATLTEADRAEMARIRKEEGRNDADPFAIIREGFVNQGGDHLNFSAAAQTYFKNCYDAEILAVDEQFGRLLKCLRDLDVEDRTTVVFASDHGESFGDHGWYGHGNTLHDPELRVPLLLRLPASLRRRERVASTVRLFDLHPTLVTLTGGDVAAGMQAKTLLRQDGTVAVDQNRECFASFGSKEGQDIYQWDQALIHGPWKVYMTDDASRIAGYNLDEDPTEAHDLLAGGAAPPSAMQQLVDRLKQLRAQHVELAASFGQPVWIPGGENYKEELSALGYL